MQPKNICQSCTMPIDNFEDRGAEKNGSKSDLYCKYCYKDGALIDPNMTIDEMKKIVTTQMQKLHLPENLIQRSVTLLPTLKRWSGKVSAPCKYADHVRDREAGGIQLSK